MDAEVSRITKKSELKGINIKTGWFINWQKELDLGHEVYGLYIKGDDTLQGLASMSNVKENYTVYGHWIVSAPHNLGSGKRYEGVGGHLYAIMGAKSVEYGYDGFFYRKVANQKLLEHYIESFGAEPLPNIEPYPFVIGEKSMYNLLDKYNFEWR